MATTAPAAMEPVAPVSTSKPYPTLPTQRKFTHFETYLSSAASLVIPGTTTPVFPLPIIRFLLLHAPKGLHPGGNDVNMAFKDALNSREFPTGDTSQYICQYRQWIRSPSYAGIITPMTQAEAQAARNTLASLKALPRAWRVLTDNEVDALDRIVDAIAGFNGQTRHEFDTSLLDKSWYQTGSGPSVEAALLRYHVAVLLRRNSHGLNSLMPYIATGCVPIGAGYRPKTALRFSSRRFVKLFNKAMEAYGVDGEQAAAAFDGTQEDVVIWRIAWMWLFDYKHLDCGYENFLRDIKRHFHFLYVKRKAGEVSIRRAWDDEDDEALWSALKALKEEGIKTMKPMMLSLLMFATYEGTGKTPKLYQAVQDRLISHYGHYALWLLKLAVPFAAVFPPAVVRTLRSLGITDTTSERQARTILAAASSAGANKRVASSDTGNGAQKRAKKA